MSIFEAILLTVITASTPLVIAALGELVTERSGVLNLGVEGMMIMGAVGAFAAAQLTGSAYIGIVGGIVSGALFSLLFAFLTLTLVANQVATGLALTILGLGASGMLGEAFVGAPGIRLLPIEIPVLSAIPYIGTVLFKQDLIFYLSILLVIAVNWFLFRSRTGLKIRAIGDNHASAHALGIDVIRMRYLAVMFGGACSGLACKRAAIADLYAAMDREHVGRARLDRTCAGGLRLLAAVASAGRWLSLRRGDDPSVACASLRYRHSLAVPIDAALRGDGCGPHHHLA